MTKTMEELRADAERGIVEYGIASYLYHDDVGRAFADECAARRRQLVAEGKVRLPGQIKPATAAVPAPAEQASLPPRPAKKKTGITKVISQYITGGEPTAPADDDQRDENGEYGDQKSNFRLS